jgi:tetratricopeptide (TPR) repeat protein
MADKIQIPELEANQVVAKAKGLWSRYSKAIIYGGSAVIILLVAYLGYKNFISGPKEQKANEAIFKAQQFYAEDSINLALNGDGANPGFLKVMSKFSGTDAANIAKFYAGSCYIKLGDNNNAVKYLKDFSTSSKITQARAYSLLADAYGDLGKKEEAISFYKKAATHFPEDAVNSSEDLYRAALMYELMGKSKEAIDAFKALKEKYPNSNRGRETDKYLARLGVLN